MDDIRQFLFAYAESCLVICAASIMRLSSFCKTFFPHLDGFLLLCYTAFYGFGLSTTRPRLLVTRALAFASGGMLAGAIFFSLARSFPCTALFALRTCFSFGRNRLTKSRKRCILSAKSDLQSDSGHCDQSPLGVFWLLFLGSMSIVGVETKRK